MLGSCPATYLLLDVLLELLLRQLVLLHHLHKLARERVDQVRANAQLARLCRLILCGRLGVDIQLLE